MQRANSFQPLFVNEKGQRYRFYIWDCAERKRVKELIEVRHGKVMKDPVGDYTIQLADPKTCLPGEVYSIYYIQECCSWGTLLDLRNYRINSTSKYSGAFSPMDVLQGLITWEDAYVFSLEYQNSQKQVIPLSTASSKRRRVSGTFSTDEELEIIEHIDKSVDSRQRKSHTYSQQTPCRGIKALRRRRGPYKMKEKEAIVQYLKHHKAYRAIKGTAIWKRMEEDKVCANRTWQSLKEHFLKRILPSVELFDFSASEVALLKKTTSSTKRKVGGDNHATLQDSDDDAASLSGNRYTPEEDEAILKYVSCDRRYLRAGGVKIWQRMERKQIVPGRSWQSLKERYRKNLVHRLNTFVNKGELNRMDTWIKGSSRSTKDCTCCEKSRSPISPLSTGDVSITSASSSELSTSNSLPHKRKLFTQHRSPVQFTPVSVSSQKSKVPGILTIAKQTTSCLNNIQPLSGNTLQCKTSASSNCEGNVIKKVVSREVLLAPKKKVGRNTTCVGNKEMATPTIWILHDKQQVRTSSIVGVCDTHGEKDISDEQQVRTSTETSIVEFCGTPGEDISNKQEIRTSSSSSTETSIVGICGTPGEDISDKQQVRTSSLSSSTQTSIVGICDTPKEDISDKQQVRTSSSSSSTETSIVGICDTPGEDISEKQQVRTSFSPSSTEPSVVGICDTPGEKDSDRQEVRTSSSSLFAETSVVGIYGTPGKKDSAVSQISCASESQKCVSSTSSDAGLGTSLTDVNKEYAPVYDQSAAANENTSKHSDTMAVTVPELVLSTTAHETGSENSFHESDPCLQQMAGTPTKESHSSLVEITANVSSSSGALEGTDSDCSPEKQGSVSLSNYTFDKPQDGVGSESSSVETYLHDKQLKKQEAQDASCLQPLRCPEKARLNGVNAASTSVKSSKRHRKRKLLHCNSPVAFAPLSETKHKTPQSQIALVSKNVQFMYGKNTATTNTSSDSSKRQKKAIYNKSKKHKDSTVGSEKKRITSKVVIAKKLEKCSKLEKLNMTNLEMENGKEKDQLISSETTSVRNLNNRVADKSLKSSFPCTSLDSFISEYISKSHKRKLSRRNVQDRKGTSDDKTSSGQHMKTQAIPSCSKNSHTDYSAKSNQETGTSTQEKETTLSSNQGILFRKTKQKQKSSFKDKVKSCQMNVTEDMDGIPDDTNSVGLHMELHETQAPPSCLKPTNYATESNQVVNTSIQEKEAAHSSTQDIPSRKTKYVPKNPFKNEKSHQTDIRRKDIRRRRMESLKSNKDISKITASNNNLHKEDITILDMIEIIPKETNCESTRSQEILSEDSETWTDPNETCALISSRNINKNDSSIIFPSPVLENKTQKGKCTKVVFSVNSYKKTPANDKSQVVHSPSKQTAWERITYAVQVCEISNSNVDMIHTQETNSSFNSKSSTCELVSLPVHNSHSSLNSATVSLIRKNAPSSMFKKCPRQSTEKPESVLCDESDNEAEHTSISQETLQRFGIIILGTPE